MAIALTILAWLILLPLLVPALVFLCEVGLGLLPVVRPQEAVASSFAILMPAHNEAPTIAGIVRPLVATLPPDARLLVVADNCSDATAATVRAAGAEVVERQDASRRGKGFALDFGRAHLRTAPPAAVIVLDADCRFARDGADAALLAGAAEASERPVQARYLLAGASDAPPMVQVSNFAFVVKNRVRQRGLARLRAPGLMTGTGMALPWHLFDRAPLATDDLVEDLALGLHLAEQGTAARYRDDIEVLSAAAGEAGTLSQRTRWEHGFLDSARRIGLGLLRRGITGRRLDLAWMALHLMTPPLALLVALIGLGVIAEAVLAWLGASPAPLVILAGGAVLIAAAVLACWFRFGRGVLAGATLLRLPLYILWKVPLYLRFFRRRERSWVRTERAPPSDSVH